jgi:hypothetical protein
MPSTSFNQMPQPRDRMGEVSQDLSASILGLKINGVPALHEATSAELSLVPSAPSTPADVNSALKRYETSTATDTPRPREATVTLFDKVSSRLPNRHTVLATVAIAASATAIGLSRNTNESPASDAQIQQAGQQQQQQIEEQRGIRIAEEHAQKEAAS